MKINLLSTSWPIRGSFTISRGSKTQADVVIVELTQDGVTGRGECVPYARYDESIASVLQQLTDVADRVEQGATRTDIQSLLPAGAARNALDCAYWDLECKLSGQTIWEKTNVTPETLITAFTLSLDTPENMYQAAVDNAHRPLLKLKLGGAGDLERVQAVRRGAPDARIILDANEAWSVDDYTYLLPELVKLNVAMIEQPFPASDDAALDTLPHLIPICADESCHDRSSLDNIIGRYEMINIKTDKTGGLTEALALKAQAQKAGLDIMVGCMLASSLSMAPAFVVAQGAQVVDLDGPLLLKEDIDNGFEFSVNQMLPFSSTLWG